MAYIIVPLDILEEVKGALTELPKHATGVCLWFLEAPPPRLNGLIIYDLHCFGLTSKQIVELIMYFKQGQRADRIFAKYIKLTDVAKVKRYEQGVVFSMMIVDTPYIAYYPVSERDFHQQQYCLYEIKTISTIKNNDDHRFYINRKKIDVTIGVGALVPAIHKLMGVGRYDVSIQSQWVPYTLTRTDLHDPRPLLDKYCEAILKGSESFKTKACAHLAEMLTKVYKSNRRYPFFNKDIPKDTVRIAKHATIDPNWYIHLQSIFNVPYLTIYNQVAIIPPPDAVAALRYRLRDCAFKETTYTPAGLQAELFDDVLNAYAIMMKVGKKVLINLIYGLGVGSTVGLRQVYTDYLIWKERYLAQQAHKDKLAYVARELQTPDVQAVLVALRTLVVNDLPALGRMETTNHTALVAEVCRTGGYRDNHNVFDIIPDFPTMHAPRFCKITSRPPFPILSAIDAKTISIMGIKMNNIPTLPLPDEGGLRVGGTEHDTTMKERQAEMKDRATDIHTARITGGDNPLFNEITRANDNLVQAIEQLARDRQAAGYVARVDRGIKRYTGSNTLYARHL